MDNLHKYVLGFVALCVFVILGDKALDVYEKTHSQAPVPCVEAKK